MSSIVVSGDTSGAVTISAPAVAGTTTITLPSSSGTMALTSGATAFTNLTVTNDATISGLTVGKGGGASSTNTGVGLNVLSSNTGLYNVAMGQNVLQNNTGNNNTAIGATSLFSNTSGATNTSVGQSAMYSNTTGSSNTAFGYNALNANTTASNNTAVGYQAGYTNSTGHDNLFYGYQAGYANTTGNYNLFIGNSSGGLNTTGGGNTFVGGSGSGGSMTTGSNNTILGNYNGNQGGLDIRTASNYIVLSDGAGNPRQIINNNAYFGFNTSDFSTDVGNIGYQYVWGGSSNNIVNTYTTSGSNRYSVFEFRRTGRTNARAAQFSLGENASNQGEVTCYSSAANAALSGGVNLANGATSWSAVSDENKKDIIEPIENGLDKVASLRAIIGKYKADAEGTRRSFLIAQDVQAVLPEAVTHITDITDGSMALGLSYTDVIPLLVSAIKDLKQIVDAQATEIAELKAKL